MLHPIISMTTDFGLKDAYVAEMKAVILDICRNASIVDITHEIEKFNIIMGSHILASVCPYFPKGAIHIAVIDPSVGTKRRSILIQTRRGYFVGPDNGVLALAAKKQGIEHVYEITNRKLMLREVSGTFHGRDIFAPAAAHLAIGTPLSDFGSEIHGIIVPDFTRTIKRKNMLIGEVLYVDSFGNIITSIEEKQLRSIEVNKTVNMKLGRTKLKLNFYRSYAEARDLKPLATIGSHNLLEIAINQGNASKTLNASVGEKVILYRPSFHASQSIKQ